MVDAVLGGLEGLGGSGGPGRVREGPEGSGRVREGPGGSRRVLEGRRVQEDLGVNTQKLDSLLVATWEEVLIKSFPYMTSSHLVASLRNQIS